MTVNTETSFLVALLIAAVVLVGYLEYSVAKGRLMKRKSARMAISLARDKAYNSTVTSRAISRNMKMQGFDVSAAEKLIASADRAIELGNYSEALQYSEDARERLLRIKQGSRLSFGDENTAGTQMKDRRDGPGASGVERLSDGPRPAKDRLPKNYAEASFAIGVLREEASSAQAAGDDASQSIERLAEAEEALRQGRYDDALNLALRGKRELSSLDRIGEEHRAKGEPRERAKDADSSMDEGERCPSCGRILHDSDVFCRGCGSRIEYRCPSCDSPLEKEDMFCGKCGAQVR